MTPICAFPWFHQLIETNGVIRPCCIYRGPRRVQPAGSTNIEFFHGHYMEDLRNRMSRGEWPDECAGCKRDEEHGRRSQRMLSWEIAESIGWQAGDQPRLMSHEVHPSNVCNIKCRMCEPGSSTKWNAEAELAGMSQVGLLESGWHLTAETARHARRLLILGGESMLHEDLIIESLSLVAEHGNLHELETVICTNMTVAPSNTLINLLRDCKYVSFSCSIDGVGRLNEYIRSDSKWSDVQTTATIYNQLCIEHQHMAMHVHPTISIMNVNELIPLIEWWQALGRKPNTFGYIWCHNPQHYDPIILPDAYKTDLLERYRSALDTHPSFKHVIGSVINQLSIPRPHDADSILERFVNITASLDARRGQYLHNCNQEVAEVCAAYFQQINQTGP